MGLAHSWGGKEKNQGKVNLQRKGNTHCGKGKMTGREWRGEKRERRREKIRIGMGEIGKVKEPFYTLHCLW